MLPAQREESYGIRRDKTTGQAFFIRLQITHPHSAASLWLCSRAFIGGLRQAELTKQLRRGRLNVIDISEVAVDIEAVLR